MTRSGVLYLSYTGLLDPLGKGQVLQYLLELAEDRPIHLVTFEHPDRLAEPGAVEALGTQCRDAGVTWHPRTRLSRLGPLGLAWGLVTATCLAVWLARSRDLGLVHCRSYLAGAMGLVVQRLAGARMIFDMRGFWPDERADAGIWRRGGLRFRLAKVLERHLLAKADHIVSLTRAGATALSDLARGPLPAVSVIPTCTNLDLFRPTPRTEGPFVLGYVGSTGSWYRFDAVAMAVAEMFRQDPSARFRIVTQSSHDPVRAQLRHAGVDLARVDLRSVPYDGVPAQIARMDAGIFFIAPVPSKRASCPTRMGEFLACGRPVLANEGVGDVVLDLAETGTGITIACPMGALPDPQELAQALVRLRALAEVNSIAETCRAAAEDRFALRHGVTAYRQIYDRMAAPGPVPGTPRDRVVEAP